MTKVEYASYLDKYHKLHPDNKQQLPTSEEFSNVEAIKLCESHISMTKSQWKEYYELMSFPY